MAASPKLILEPLLPQQIAAWKAMSFTAKARLVERLFQTAKALKKARLIEQHPEWTNDEIDRAVKRIFLCAHT